MSTRAFTSDVAQLIKLVTHSVYSNQEVFLRELISNASDALAKAKLKSLQEPDYLGDETDLRITIDVDQENKTLSITDS
jgi:molecular chaperone HtpG